VLEGVECSLISGNACYRFSYALLYKDINITEDRTKIFVLYGCEGLFPVLGKNIG
jgi:hypothetical protein